jgi:hypothetical protein
MRFPAIFAGHDQFGLPLRNFVLVVVEHPDNAGAAVYFCNHRLDNWEMTDKTSAILGATCWYCSIACRKW